MSFDQIFGQEVEQHPVVVGAVRAALVAAHDAHAAEADFLVCSDGANIVGGGIDGDAVVSLLLEEETANKPNRLRSEAFALRFCRKNEVDARVPVVPVELLPSRDPTDGLVVDRDDEGGDALGFVRAVPSEEVPVGIVVGLTPSPRDSGLSKAFPRGAIGRPPSRGGGGCESRGGSSRDAPTGYRVQWQVPALLSDA